MASISTRQTTRRPSTTRRAFRRKIGQSSARRTLLCSVAPPRPASPRNSHLGVPCSGEVPATRVRANIDGLLHRYKAVMHDQRIAEEQAAEGRANRAAIDFSSGGMIPAAPGGRVAAPAGVGSVLGVKRGKSEPAAGGDALREQVQRQTQEVIERLKRQRG